MKVGKTFGCFLCMFYGLLLVLCGLSWIIGFSLAFEYKHFDGFLCFVCSIPGFLLMCTGYSWIDVNVRTLAEGANNRLKEEEHPGTCESCGKPSTTTDSEDVPLCEECASDLEKEALNNEALHKEQLELVSIWLQDCKTLEKEEEFVAYALREATENPDGSFEELLAAAGAETDVTNDRDSSISEVPLQNKIRWIIYGESSQRGEGVGAEELETYLTKILSNLGHRQRRELENLHTLICKTVWGKE